MDDQYQGPERRILMQYEIRQLREDVVRFRKSMHALGQQVSHLIGWVKSEGGTHIRALNDSRQVIESVKLTIYGDHQSVGLKTRVDRLEQLDLPKWKREVDKSLIVHSLYVIGANFIIVLVVTAVFKFLWPH